MKFRILIFAVISLIWADKIYGQTYSLAVKVEGFTGTGHCIISLITEGDTFLPSTNSFKRVVVAIDSSRCFYQFNKLPEGNYAVIVFHDENNDSKLNTNFFGIPKEGIGNSNNHDGKPSFEKSKIELYSNKSILIKLWYL